MVMGKFVGKVDYWDMSSELGHIKSKYERGVDIFVDLHPLFNIAPFIKADGSIDYEMLADWSDGGQEKMADGAKS